MKLPKALFFAMVVLLSTSALFSQDALFQEHRVPVEKEKPQPPKLIEPLAKEHSKAIRRALRDGPNFAGHYTIASWGCGSSCAVFVIVDDRNGRVHEPPELSRGVYIGVAPPEFHADSTVILMFDCKNPQTQDPKDCSTRAYDWNGERLIPVAKQP